MRRHTSGNYGVSLLLSFGQSLKLKTLQWRCCQWTLVIELWFVIRSTEYWRQISKITELRDGRKKTKVIQKSRIYYSYTDHRWVHWQGNLFSLSCPLVLYGQLKILCSSVKSESDFQKRSKVILSSSIESGVVAVSAALLKQCAITTFKKCFLAMMTIMVEHQWYF